FCIGDAVLVTNATSGTAVHDVTPVQRGLALKFTPYIMAKGRIRLTVSGKVKSPNLTARDFDTAIDMREGQTLVLTGLSQSTPNSNANRIPFLGDLPLVGGFFSLEATTASEKDLVILISPELVPLPEPKKTQSA